MKEWTIDFFKMFMAALPISGEDFLTVSVTQLKNILTEGKGHRV